VLARRGHPTVKGRVDVRHYRTSGHIFVGNPDGASLDEEPFDREVVNATYGPLPGPRDGISTQGYVNLWETALLMVAGSDVLVECPRRLANKYAKKLGLQVLQPPYKPFRFTIQAVRRQTADAGVDWLLACIKPALGESKSVSAR
jgi:hypothetical protein